MKPLTSPPAYKLPPGLFGMLYEFLRRSLCCAKASQVSMTFMRPSILSCLFCVLLLQGVATGEVRANQDDAVESNVSVQEYLQRVKPVLIERCLACHGALKQEAGLRIDTAESMLDAGVVTPGDAEGSVLVDRLVAKEDDYRMPPEGHALAEEQIAAIKAWIEQGAWGPENELPEPDPQAHWAFESPRKVPLSELESASPPQTLTDQHPIDVLLERTRRDRHVTALGPASRELQIRRVYLDLIGLPPSPDEVARFVHDSREDAWERVVDRLLASPQYGERWGRHWMDVWRYSDWYGLGAQLRNSQKHLWHWRDWIVESLNRDEGYDRMVQLMLAADELEPNNREALRATGFLARNYYLFNRTTWLDETIEHTSKAFLGLTFNCAKCHDHKYDPISQTDYYRMRAIFEPHHVRLDPVPGTTSFERDGIPRVYDQHLDRPTYVHIRGDAASPDESQVMAPGVPAVLGNDSLAIEPIDLPLESYKPALQSETRIDQLEVFRHQVENAQRELVEAQERLSTIANPTNEEAPLAGKLVFATDFSSRDDASWREMGGDWTFTDEGAHQSKVGATSHGLRFLREPPSDFVATLDFVTLGGQQWKSVGIAFDVSPVGDANAQRVLVYLSAVDGGSKLQIAHGPTSGPTYPDAGRVAMSVLEGVPYSLEVAVRGNRINVRVNEQLRLAFDLPGERVPGELELVTFDAEARLPRFTLHRLHDDAAFQAPGVKALTRPQAEAAVKLAEADVVRRELERDAWKAACAAEIARANCDDTSSAQPSTAATEVVREEITAQVMEAARMFQRFEAAQAEYELAEIQSKLTLADDAKGREALEQQRQNVAARLKTINTRTLDADSPYLTIRGGEKALEGPDEDAASRASAFPRVSTGRRRAFAEWLTSEQNPLTARVAVNHIWMRHFGQPLVESVSDFGRRADPPVQQELLDWLACEFMEHDWSMKHLHRLIVTSAAYRLSSQQQLASPTTLNSDPENQTFWCRRAMRMESEVVRDSLWKLAGLLDGQLGGPSMPIKESQPPYRRSLYFVHSRDDQQRFLAMFDNADILRCYRREESVIPQQALALSNSKEAIEAAQHIASQLESVTKQRDFFHAAYKLILGVTPTSEELQACEAGFARFVEIARQAEHPQPEARAREMIVLALLNCNDFITIR